jgi:hypothetical protein
MNDNGNVKFNRNRRQSLVVYFIPYTKEPGRDTISTRVPLLYSVLKEHTEVLRAPQSLNAKIFLLNRILLLITSAKSLLSLFRIYLRNKERIVIFGSDQPAGFIAAVLGTLTRHLWKSKSIHIFYDSHGSRYKLAIDLNQPLIYRIISVFEDSLSVKVADLVIIPTYADKVIYAQYTRKKTKFIILPSLVRTDNVVFNEWNKRRFEFAFHANFGYPPNIEALKIISRWLEDKSGINLVIFGVNSRIAYKYIAPKTLRQNEIRIFGYIDNPYLILGNTKFYLAPIFKGTGIITKVLEAMASGAVPITTKFVALGIPELRQWPELIASNTSDWIGKAEKHLVGVYKLDYDAISKKLIDMTNKNYGYSANKLLLRNALEKLGYADRV